MTNINTRDGSEYLRAVSLSSSEAPVCKHQGKKREREELFRNVSAAVSETTRNWKEIREGRKLREDNLKYPTKR